MQNTDILNAYGDDPEKHNLDPVSNSRKKIRCSKLKPATKFILELWSEGRSLQFICDRLLFKNSISCHRSTVQRFLKKALSL